MSLFAVLAGALILIGVAGLFLLPTIGPISGWLGALILLLFGVVMFSARSREGVYRRCRPTYFLIPLVRSCLTRG
jgi:hypothetical protein